MEAKVKIIMLESPTIYCEPDPILISLIGGYIMKRKPTSAYYDYESLISIR